MFIHKILRFLIVMFFGVLLASCSNDSTAANEEVKVNLDETATINFTINGDVSPKGAVVLTIDNQMKAFLPAAYTGAYAINDMPVYDSEGNYITYSLYYFIDQDSSVYLESDEEWSLVELDTINMLDVGVDAEPLSYDLVYYHGNVVFHSAMSNGTFLSKYAWLYTKSGKEPVRMIPVDSEGNFEFIEKRQGSSDSEEATYYDLYAFYDDSGSEEMYEVNTPVVFIQTLNTYYSSYVYSELVKVSGSVSFTPPAQVQGIYPFTSGVNPPVIRVQDQNYWRSVVQPFRNAQQNSGTYTADFTLFVPKNRLIDIRMYHVQSDISDYTADAKKKIIMPVQLAGVHEYGADTVIHGIGGASNPMKIHTISGKLRRDPAVVTDGNVIAVVGSFPITYNLYAFSNNTFQDTALLKTSNIPTDQDMDVYVFFRDYDRTTATDGALNDALLTANFYGYASYFNVKFAVDANYDVMYVAGEPVSNKYYYGDSDDNGLPEYGNACPLQNYGCGDYNDNEYPSYIDSDKTISAGFVIQ